MRIKEILQTVGHRPWELPEGNWSYYQEWNEVIFLHWKVDIRHLREHLPKELEIDLFEGDAWVSIVAFTMEKIRPRNVPSFSPISNFHELNIRTYVRYRRKPGVYFLSIEGGTKLSCQVAKKMSDLPYRYSTIKRNKTGYTSENIGFNDYLNLSFQIEKPIIQKSILDKWLTERYVLYQETRKFINEFEIHHEEWPIHRIVLIKEEIEYPRFNRLLNTDPVKRHYSPGVKVIAWGKKQYVRDLSDN